MGQTVTNSAPARGPADHDVRNQIVAAATEHFSHYGYEKTTVSDLARSIGFSKAYIYKFFESKQAIGEMICANCLSQIEAEVRAAVNAADHPPEKLRRLFKAIVEASLRLFSQDRKLYEIATCAASERWGRRSITRSASANCFKTFCRKVAKAETSSVRHLWMKPSCRFIWSSDHT